MLGLLTCGVCSSLVLGNCNLDIQKSVLNITNGIGTRFYPHNQLPIRLIRDLPEHSCSCLLAELSSKSRLSTSDPFASVTVYCGTMRVRPPAYSLASACIFRALIYRASSLAKVQAFLRMPAADVEPADG